MNEMKGNPELDSILNGKAATVNENVKMNDEQAGYIGDTKSPIMLAMDTSTASLTIAVTEGERLLGSRHAIAERNHSRYLVPYIHELLQSLHLAPHQIDALCVGAGPGSYTGVRIGITVAKTMGWTLSRPVYTVSSLAALASGAYRQWTDNPQVEEQIYEANDTTLDWVIPLVDARRKQVFTGLYVVGDSGSIQSIVDDGIRLMSEWVQELSQMLQESTSPPRRILFVGEVDKFSEEIELRGLRKSSFEYSTDRNEYSVEGNECLFGVLSHSIDAYDVACLAYPQWKAGVDIDVHRLVPNYTQLPEAEVKLLAKSRQETVKGD